MVRKIRVTIRKDDGTMEQKPLIPVNMKIKELVKAYRERMDLPKVDRRTGEEIVYYAINKSTQQQLNYNHTLEQAGVQDGDTLIISFQLVPGEIFQ